MIFNTKTLIVIFGLILLSICGIVITKLYERNPEEAEVLSPYVGIPIVLWLYYLYMKNFSYITYIVSIGAIFILFV